MPSDLHPAPHRNISTLDTGSSVFTRDCRPHQLKCIPGKSRRRSTLNRHPFQADQQHSSDRPKHRKGEVLGISLIPKIKTQETVKRPENNRSSKDQKFHNGAHVFVRDYRSRKPQWTDGTILRPRGNVMYDVQVGQNVWSRHRNQLRPRHSTTENTSDKLPKDIILETFNLPPDPTPAVITQEDRRTLQPRRWTSRKRKPVKPIQVDPRQSHYRSAD